MQFSDPKFGINTRPMFSLAESFLTELFPSAMYFVFLHHTHICFYADKYTENSPSTGGCDTDLLCGFEPSQKDFCQAPPAMLLEQTTHGRLRQYCIQANHKPGWMRKVSLLCYYDFKPTLLQMAIVIPDLHCWLHSWRRDTFVRVWMHFTVGCFIKRNTILNNLNTLWKKR